MYVLMYEMYEIVVAEQLTANTTYIAAILDKLLCIITFYYNINILLERC